MRFSSLFLNLSCFIFCGAAHAQAPKTWNFADANFKEDAANPLVSPYVAPGGAPSGVRVERKAGALRFTNGAGGSFGVKFNVAPFDAAQYPTIAFNYTRSASAKINFFFKVNGSYYGVIFSGPNRVRPGSFLLGNVPNVGERGRVVIPLRDWLRRFQPKAEKLQVEEMLAGNWDNEGYLLAGIGGNGPGATWSLSSFSLQNAADSAARFATPAFEGNRIVWPMTSGVLDTTKAVFSLDESQKFGFDSRFLRFETALDAKNTASSRVVFDAGDAGINFKDGQKLNLSLDSAKESLIFSLGSHASGVPLPRLKWNDFDAPDTLLNADFEMPGSAEDFAEGGNAVMQLDATLPASGQNSLQFTNPRTASPFDKSFKIVPFDAAQFPMLTFAYRNDDRLRLDFRLRWEDKNYLVRFTDRDGAQTKLGEIENIPDGQWHRGQIPLWEWMKKARPDATNFKVDYFGVSDDAWMGNARAVKWNLDEFRAAPRQGEAIRATVMLRDVAGVKAVSYSIDQKSEGDVDRTPEGGPKLDISLAGRAGGLYWLHLRAQNGSGVWSEAAHFPFFVG